MPLSYSTAGSGLEAKGASETPNPSKDMDHHYRQAAKAVIAHIDADLADPKGAVFHTFVREKSGLLLEAEKPKKPNPHKVCNAAGESPFGPPKVPGPNSVRKGYSSSKSSKPPRHHTPAPSIESLIRAIHGSFRSATPLNQIVAFTYSKFDDGATDAALNRIISDALRYHGIEPTTAGIIENPLKGSNGGKHIHLAFHIPPAIYAAVTDTIRARLSKRCATNLRQLAQRKGIKVKTRATAEAIYLTLFSVCPRELPFMIEGADPIPPSEMKYKAQRYFSKSIDPDHILSHRADGTPITTADLSGTDYALTLEKQSPNRPSRPVRLSRQALALSRSAAGQEDKRIIANTLSTRIEMDSKVAGVLSLLKKLPSYSSDAAAALPPEPENSPKSAVSAIITLEREEHL